ncbi:MAG TPA: hypothetical protein VHP80_03055 [Candidatus Acidoferrum sp.]|jgi:hypothetical protein|nr:hypothetical protein [Candidatus Acidoferrum sp.]
MTRFSRTRILRTIAATAVGLLFAGAAMADSLELKDGRVLTGRFLGGTQALMRFSVNGEVQTFNVSEIVALTFTSDYGNPPPPPPQPAAPPPQPQAAVAPAPAAVGSQIVIPAGQSLLVRMIDGVDSKTNNVGDIFHASLETDLNVNGTLVARKGTDVYGRLANAKGAGRLAGSSELQLELTRMVINGQDYPVVSSDYTMKGKGRGANTAEKVGGGAALGAIIGAIAGGGRGAAIGAGAGSAAGAGVNVVTRGQQVKIPSETLLEFRLQQPVTVTALG